MNKRRSTEHQTLSKWAPITISVFSLAIAAASLSISFETYVARQENVEVAVKPVWHGYESSISEVLSGSYYALSTYWEMTLSNTSDRTLSLVEYDIREMSYDREVTYRNLDQGLFTADGIKVNLPISLDPGKSVVLRLKIGVGIMPDIYKFALQNWGTGNPFPIEELALRLFSEKRIDIFGNELTGYMHVRFGKVIPYPGDKFNEKAIIVRIKTSRGNEYSALSSWYKPKEGIEESRLAFDGYLELLVKRPKKWVKPNAAKNSGAAHP